jgi:hypothetical protein
LASTMRLRPWSGGTARPGSSRRLEKAATTRQQPGLAGGARAAAEPGKI